MELWASEKIIPIFLIYSFIVFDMKKNSFSIKNSLWKFLIYFKISLALFFFFSKAEPLQDQVN